MPDMPESLHDRWTNLVEAIRQECGDDGQHADLLEVDERTLKTRLPIHAGTCCVPTPARPILREVSVSTPSGVRSCLC